MIHALRYAFPRRRLQAGEAPGCSGARGKRPLFTQSFGGSTADLNPNGPFWLCVPVDKNDEDAGALTDPQAMVCYTTRNDHLPFNQFTAFATNQFGGLTVVGTQFD